MTILPVMFCLGFFSVLAQVMFTREAIVVFLGNELSIGVILGIWLTGVSLGAVCWLGLRRLVSAPANLDRLLVGLLLLLAVVFPLEVHALRLGRAWLAVPVGEYVSLWKLVRSAALAFLPVCFVVGMLFPGACERLARSNAGRLAAWPVSPVYAAEALGAAVGGAGLTYVLLPAMISYRIVFLGSALCVLAAVWLAPSGAPRRFVGIVLVVLLAFVARPGPIRQLEASSTEARWRASGVLPAPGSPAALRVRLMASADSVYQNLAVIENEGQMTVYGNGQVLFDFPDPAASEQKIHFIMAQKPRARRVLLIGGNPVSDIPELLKYPSVRRLVHVEFDPAIGELVQPLAGAEWPRSDEPGRLLRVAEDGYRYVKNCPERFDVVIAAAPQPTTAAANRFYTIEFYRVVRRILAPDGFVHAAVAGSERLESETASLGASVYGSLTAVFPVVRVTAGTENQFFAGSERAGLTFDPQALAARSREAGVETGHFKPEYFLRADEIAPDDTESVKRKFAESRSRANTNLRPIAYFQNLVLWSRYSGSGVEAFLLGLERLKARRVAAFLFSCVIVCLAAGLALGRAGAGKGRGGRSWVRAVTFAAVGATGFAGMAMEVIFIFSFQCLYGCVYTLMGLIVGLFMVGLVLGALSGRRLAARGSGRAWGAMAALESLLVLLPLAVPWLIRWAADAEASRFAAGVAGAGMYAAIAATGWLVGAQFQVSNRLFLGDKGGAAGVSAAITSFADCLGSAAGCLLAGAVLVPVLGIAAACAAVSAVKATSLLCVGACALASGPLASRSVGD